MMMMEKSPRRRRANRRSWPLLLVVAGVVAIVLQCLVGGAAASIHGGRSTTRRRTTRRTILLTAAHQPQQQQEKKKIQSRNQIHVIPRGGGATTTTTTTTATTLIAGSKADALILLAVTAFTTPLCERILKISPILGYLLLGLWLGPNGMGVISDIHAIEHIAECGIVLFLFEMGLHLDLETLWEIRSDVFGVGFTQFAATALVIGLFCHMIFHLSKPASLVIGWSLALSSSAFVLQLLKDKKETKTAYGKSAFGILLLQDLMVVPLLVMTPLLATASSGSASSSTSVKTAITKAVMSMAVSVVTIVGVFGQFLLLPLLQAVAATNSTVAFTSLVLAAVFGSSFLTEGLGLSNTLGAFLMGMVVAEKTKSKSTNKSTSTSVQKSSSPSSQDKHVDYKHEIEHSVGTIQGILVAFFFFTVGFEIDVHLIVSKPRQIMSLVVSILMVKISLAMFACRPFGIPWSIAQRIGLVLSQGGEFAFVAFKTARMAGILTKDTTRLLSTAVALTMACTPVLEELGAYYQPIWARREKIEHAATTATTRPPKKTTTNVVAAAPTKTKPSAWRIREKTA
jgi:monovalent cation:H+ antiporter-2, CPA2 family